MLSCWSVTTLSPTAARTWRGCVWLRSPTIISSPDSPFPRPAGPRCGLNINRPPPRRRGLPPASSPSGRSPCGKCYGTGGPRRPGANMLTCANVLWSFSAT
ncbi:hypothetical protein B0T25DRAFT_185585 [Lasiosphaeria hispida]|uniref:Uncharacterized protein n=1 Tax=Lasiosphaeria hispida TaxID=260671 RepID=A0AAJ0MDF7_9PEZI|nr:hypothetical protein B0T25DRAFT_185585 [Lasiosphaeria hispida]